MKTATAKIDAKEEELAKSQRTIELQISQLAIENATALLRISAGGSKTPVSS
jgi:hypothetical protein